MRRLLALTPVVFLLVALGCAETDTTVATPEVGPTPDEPAATVADPDTALFAGGCFWCMEPPFEKLDGVVSVVSGFAGGQEPNPTYDAVSSGRTGHAEVVRVVYDADVISYGELLDVFWHNVDPFDAGGQFCDRGLQYRSAVFALGAAQRRLAEASKEAVEARLGDAVVTEVHGAYPFTPAEAYHQDFYRTNPDRYTSYRRGCGRDARLQAVWGDDAGH